MSQPQPQNPPQDPQQQPQQPPQAQNTQPPANPPQNPFQQRAQFQQQGNDFSPLLDAINALPERLVNAVRESQPQPPAPVVNPPAQPGNAATGQQSPGEAQHRGSGEAQQKKTFAERWFSR